MVTTLALNAGYVALVAASFTRTMVTLRTVLIAAAAMLALFGLIEGIYSMMVWNLVIGGSHAFVLGRELTARRRTALSDEDLALAVETFPGLNLADVRALWSAGEEGLGRDLRLTTAGAPSSAVTLLIAGEVEVRRGSEVIAILGAGSLIGEMSLARNGVASADVVARGPLWTRAWTAGTLAEIAESHPATSSAFADLMQRDMADKLDRSNR